MTTPAEITRLLQPCTTAELPLDLPVQLAEYLDLLLRWNARTNLTAVRLPAQIVQTHFGESIFAAQHLPPGLSTLLDFGSGAGFPGLPIQLFHPHLQVTLAESQGKKAVFLREAVRTLQLSTTVHHGRVQDLPPGALFSAVSLRAVDNMAEAIPAAIRRLAPGGWLLLLTSLAQSATIHQSPSALHWHPPLPIPNSSQRVLLFAQQAGLPPR